MAKHGRTMSGGDLEAGVERTKALDMALGQIEKQFGTGAVMKMGDKGSLSIETVPTGALALEQMRRVFGIPEMRIPINENFNVVSLPELSVYSNRDRAGVAEFSGFLYEAKTGAPLGAVLPMIGQYRIRSHKLFMIVTWGQQQAQPGQRDPGSSWTEF